MATWRFTLVGLFGAVGFLGMAFGALTNPSLAWTWVVVSGTIVLLTYAVLAAIFRRGTARSFWVGFALVGWGYVYFVAHDKLGYGIPMQWSPYGEITTMSPSEMPTTELLLGWAAYICHDSRSDQAGLQAVPTYGSPAAGIAEPAGIVEPVAGTNTSAANQDPDGAIGASPAYYAAAQVGPPSFEEKADLGKPLRLFRIGQYLFALLFAGVGGLSGRQMDVCHRRSTFATPAE